MQHCHRMGAGSAWRSISRRDFRTRGDAVGDKILFVDDEVSVLEGYKRLLRLDFSVDTAVGGYAGMAAMKANGPFAVVVSDMRMPDMNGVEFLAQVRQKSPQSVRMLLTGHSDFEAAIEAVNRGNIYKFLTKPCNKPTLMAALESGLTLYRESREQRELAEKARVIEHAKSDWDAPEPQEAAELETASGLPGTERAKEYLQSRIGIDRQCYVLMIKLTMLNTVEVRYGEKAATDYLMSAVQFLAHGLHEGDQLFQWSNDVFMAVIRRHIVPAAVRMEASRLFMDCPQHVVEQGGRKTMVAITMIFDLLPVAQFTTLDQLMAAFKSQLIDAV
jgi:YesN/AraC family two-component response regulator